MIPWRLAATLILALLSLATPTALPAQTPKYGGVLTVMDECRRGDRSRCPGEASSGDIPSRLSRSG